MVSGAIASFTSARMPTSASLPVCGFAFDAQANDDGRQINSHRRCGDAERQDLAEVQRV